jgi:hypothetical protein
MTRASILFSLLLFTVGCRQATPSRAADPVSEITRVLDAQVRAWNAGDIEGYMQGYWKADSVRFMSGKGVTTGWKQTLERYKKGYPNADVMGTLRFAEVGIDLLSDSSAVVTGRWELARHADRPWGYFMLLMKYKAQGWCVVLDHTSSAATP